MRFFLVSFLLLLMSISMAQPGPRPIVSIESRCLLADTVIVGRVVQIGTEEPFTGGVRPVVFEVLKTLKGKPESQITIRTKSTETDLRIWKTKQTHLAVLSMGGVAFYDIVDIGSDDLVLSRDDFSIVRRGKDFLSTAEKACRQGTNAKYSNYIIVRPPANEVGKRWKEAFENRPKLDSTHSKGPWENTSDGLAVSLSPAQEAQARKGVRSADLYTVEKSLEVLLRCPSAENEKAIRQASRSKLFTVVKSGEENQGFEVRRNEISDSANRALQALNGKEGSPSADTVVDVLDELKRLRWKGDLDERAVAGLSKNRTIESLTIEDANLTVDQMKMISSLSKLRELRLIRCSGLDKPTIEAIANLGNLRVVDLTETTVSDAVVMPLLAMKKLEELNLEQTDVTTAGFKSILLARPDLRVIPEHPASVLFTYLERDDIAMVKRALKDDPNAINDRGFMGGTPLHRVCGWGRADLIQLFLDAGADIEALDNEGKTPVLWLASRYGCEPSLMKLLIDHGADLSKKDKNGMNALLLAMNNANRSLVPLLVACGADPAARDNRGRNALQMPFGPNEAERSLIQGRIDYLANPVKFVPEVRAECGKPVYQTTPNLVDRWSSTSSGTIAGPVGWQTTPSGKAYLGPFNQQALTLSLDKLPAHKHLRVEIELFVIGSWDGNGSFGAGPDILDISLPGRGALLHSSFFNNTDDGAERTPLQSYPDPFAFGFHKGFARAAETRTLGFSEVWSGKTYHRDAVYKLSYTFEHDLSSLNLVFSGMTVPQYAGMGLLDEERWGLGSVKVYSD